MDGRGHRAFERTSASGPAMPGDVRLIILDELSFVIPGTARSAMESIGERRNAFGRIPGSSSRPRPGITNYTRTLHSHEAAALAIPRSASSQRICARRGPVRQRDLDLGLSFFVK